MEASDGDDEIGVVAEAHQHADLTFNRDEQDPRVVQRGEEVHPLLVELEGTGEVDLDQDEREILGGDGEFQDAEDRDIARRDLDDDAQPRLISVGSPQPSFASGPIKNTPTCGGKIARRSLMIR